MDYNGDTVNYMINYTTTGSAIYTRNNFNNDIETLASGSFYSNDTWFTVGITSRIHIDEDLCICVGANCDDVQSWTCEDNDRAAFAAILNLVQIGDLPGDDNTFNDGADVVTIDKVLIIPGWQQSLISGW